jgi:hypothetical protein
MQGFIVGYCWFPIFYLSSKSITCVISYETKIRHFPFEFPLIIDPMCRQTHVIIFLNWCPCISCQIDSMMPQSFLQLCILEVQILVEEFSNRKPSISTALIGYAFIIIILVRAWWKESKSLLNICMPLLPDKDGCPFLSLITLDRPTRCGC